MRSLDGGNLLLFSMWFGLAVFVLPAITWDIIKNWKRK